MKRATFQKVVFLVGFIVIGLLAFMLPTQFVRAQGVLPTPDQILTEIMQLVAGGFVSLVGVPALIGALVNVGKYIGFVKNDTSANWSAGLSLFAFIAVVVFRVLRPDIMLDVLDGYAGQFAQIIVYLMSFIVMMIMPAAMHAKLKAAQVPLLGKSFSQ
jgi:hypothetical protein